MGPPVDIGGYGKRGSHRRQAVDDGSVRGGWWFRRLTSGATGMDAPT